MIYSTRFYAGLVPGAAAMTLWTTPAGYVDVIKTVVVSPESDGDPDYGHLYIAVTGNPPVLATSSLAYREELLWNGRMVINAGESVRWAGTTRDYKVSVSGYRLVQL